MKRAVRGEGDHLAALDGLRGIAIALVVWYHIWQITWLPANLRLGPAMLNVNTIPEAGFVGVDLFFFISGFVLFYPYARTLFDGRPHPTIREFAARRAVKILPSYYLSIVVVSALGWANFTSAGDAVAQLASHALFVHIWSDDTYGGINGVLWSLAVEVQFYVLFPLVSFCAMRRPALTFGFLAALGLGYRLLVAHRFDAVHEIQQLPGTIDLFAAGMFTAYAFRGLAKRTPKLARERVLWTSVAILGTGASVLSLRGAYDARVLPDWPTLWYVLGRSELAASFVVLTLGSLFAFPAWQRALANPVFTFLSLVSYNLYLYHQLIARELFAAHLPGWTATDPRYDAPWGLAFSSIAVVVSLGVAWSLTTFVEQPFVRRRKRAAGRPQDLASASV